MFADSKIMLTHYIRELQLEAEVALKNRENKKATAIVNKIIGALKAVELMSR